MATVTCHKPASTVLQSVDNGIVRSTQLSSRVDHTFQDRVQVESRAGDDVKHLACRRLVFERLGQLARARLLRLEQPRVLDGYDCLVGEGLEQIDLSAGELADLSTSDSDHANCLAHAHQRNL